MLNRSLGEAVLRFFEEYKETVNDKVDLNANWLVLVFNDLASIYSRLFG